MFVPLLIGSFSPPAPGPVITSITPDIGPLAGRPNRVIAGSGFTGATGVSVNSIAVQSFVVDSDIQITCELDDEVSYGAHDVIVTTPAGSDTLVGGYEHWAPPAETIQAYYEKGFYSDVGSGTWTATVGTNVTGTAEPNPVAIDGCPDYEASTDWPLGNAVTVTTWCGTGNHTLFACVQLESITGTGGEGVIADVSAFIALRFKKTGANYFVEMYEWDGTTKLATLDITTLVDSNGAGFMIIQGRKTGGNLQVRASGGVSLGSWTTGNACGTMTGGGALRLGAANSTVDGIMRCVGSKTSDWSDTAADKFERFCTAEYV